MVVSELQEKGEVALGLREDASLCFLRGREHLSPRNHGAEREDKILELAKWLRLASHF